MTSGKIARTSEEMREILRGYGYTLIQDFWVDRIRKFVTEDFYGYKYHSNLTNLINPNVKLKIVDVGNPYTLENIKNWLFINYKNFELCENNEYSGSKIPLWFKCFECEDFFHATWNDIQGGQNCAICAGKQLGNFHDLGNLRPDIAAEWDYDKNILTPRDFTHASSKKVFWKCSECDFKWDATILNRTFNGTGCPNCALSSDGEAEIERILIFYKIEFSPEKRFENCKDKKCLPFDFHIIKYNLCIEYQGIQHFKAIKFFGGEDALKSQKKRDKIKQDYCKKNNILLLIIPYTEINNIEKILVDTFHDLKVNK